MVGADLVKARLGWCSPAYAWGPATSVSVARGHLSELPVGSGGVGSCLASALQAARLDDRTTPPLGDGFWYLVRAANSCGVGSYGFTSEGSEREGPIISSCPVNEAELCVATGGWWDVNSCGHYWCGLPPDCDAIIPGCDCGEGRSFAAGTGCFDDESCP